MTRTMRFLILTVLCVAPTTADLDAQRRAVPRTPNRHVVVAPHSYRPYYPYYRPYYYRPYYAPYFYAPYLYWPAYYWPGFSFGFGVSFSNSYYPGYYPPYYGGYYGGYYGQYPYPAYPVYYDNTGSARLQVTPRNAQVYVDGYLVGVVDDFDGYLQRLHVVAGEHEVQFYLEGYRTAREKVLFRPGATVRITAAMQPLASGETNEPRPAPDPSARAQHDPQRYPSRQYGASQPSEFGVLSVRVHPADAVVVVDGQVWDRPAGEETFVIDLPEGRHQLEVRKDGFRSYTRTIEIRRGETMTLNVSLATGGVRTAD